MAEEKQYYLKIYNLPPDTSWAQLKDYVRLQGSERLSAEYSDVDEVSRCGWVYFEDSESLQRAYDSVKKRGLWKGYSLTLEECTTERSSRAQDGSLYSVGPSSGANIVYSQNHYDLSPKAGEFSAQDVQQSSPSPISSTKYENGYSEFEATTPAVVDGSKYRHTHTHTLRGQREASSKASLSNDKDSRAEQSQSSKKSSDSKSKKNRGGDSKGKGKHKKK